MRQAGFLAAAGIYALDHHVERLAIDHQHATALANTLAECEYIDAVMPVETNIVIVKVDSKYNAAALVRSLGDKGVLCNTTGPDTIRFVTHLDVSSDMIDQAIAVLRTIQPAVL